MKRFALIGHPVAGSLSPRLFAAAYGGRYPYELADFPTFDEAWQAFLDRYAGVNVTAPFKQDAFRQAQVLTSGARAAGAANLLVKTPQGILGGNSDVDGVLGALRETGLHFHEALVVGTGGAARAAVAAARELGLSVTVTGRSAEKAAALGCPFRPLEDARTLTPELILYTLPGSAPVPTGLPVREAVVLEAEYRRPQLASSPCRQYIHGHRWLLHQAIAGYSLLTGETPDVQEILRTL